MTDEDPFMPVEEKLRLQARAYKQLLAGSESLLEHGALYWTERLLLKLVRSLYNRRLAQVIEYFPDEQMQKDPPVSQKEALLDAAAEAALGGHDLGQWEPVYNGYEASCKLCQATTWIGECGLRYSLLEDICPGRRNAE